MKKILILLLLATSANASDKRITVLNTVHVKLVSSNSDISVPHTIVSEVKLLCIAGYKYTMVKAGYPDLPVIFQQVFKNTGHAARCDD